MKNNKTQLIARILIMVIVAFLGFNFFTSCVFAEEDNTDQVMNEETTVNVEQLPQQPDTEGLSIDEANEQIELYNEQVDEYNENLQQEYEMEVAEVEQHNAAEDAKVEENEQQIKAYEESQAKIEKHAEKGPQTKTDDVSELPADYEPTVEANKATTIKVTEAEEKSGNTVKVMNMHFFFDEEAVYDGYMPNDLDDLLNNEDIREHTVLAEWETIEVDQNDTIQTISESEAMGYSSSAFYKYIDGYVNGYWYPTLTMFTSTAVNSENVWYKGVSQIASYNEGTTDRRDPVDMFSLYTYSFFRRGPEAEYVEKYEADYKQMPTEPQMLEKMDLLTEPEVQPEPEVKVIEVLEVTEDPTPIVEEEIVEVITNNDDNDPTPTEVEEIEIADNVTPQAAPEVATVEEEAIEVVAIVADNAPALTVAEEIVEIEEAPVETIEEVFEIAENEAPLAQYEMAEAQPASWALVNLLSTIVTAVVALIMAITFFRNSDEDEDENNGLNKVSIEENSAEEEDEEVRRRSKFLGLLPAIVSIILFLLTEDMRNPMILIDRYTLMMVIIMIINLGLSIITRNKKEKDNDYKQQLQTTAA